MKFLFPSLVSFARRLKLLKMRGVIIAGYENSSRLHSSDGLRWRTWRIVLINSCSAKGKMVLREQTSRSERHEIRLQTNPKEDAVYRPN
jgi:hypothetical protein